MLFWSSLGLGLFYLAYRYNVFFVTDTKIDTRGLIYPRALKQLFAGVYLAEACMIGLFAVSVAIGPLILMIVFFIFTILFHLTLNSALNPLLYNLPRSLEAEEESFITDLEGTVGVDPGQEGENVKTNNGKTKIISKLAPGGEDMAVEKPGNFLNKFLKPWEYADYPTLRRLVPHGHIDLDHLYPEEAELDAYFPPSVTSHTPLLWIPEDAAGVSKQEIAHTSKAIPITDEGCTLDEKNKLVWDTEGVRPPIWNEKLYY
jgi:calcium permeable stress-gated cation channel